jgi:purine-binding chemotaxis protein CheW
MSPAERESTTTPWLRLSVGEGVCAVAVERVREILQVGRLTAMPRTPAVVRGVMNLRGAVVPVIDLGVRLSGEPVRLGRRSCIVVVETGASGSTPVMGMLVDAVYEVLDVAEPEVSAVPAIGTRFAPEALRGIYRAGDSLVHLLDIDRVLSEHELASQIAAHAA